MMILNSNSELEEIFIQNPTNSLSNGRLNISGNSGLKIDHIKFESNGSLISYSGNIGVKQLTPEQTSNIANIPWRASFNVDYNDQDYPSGKWILMVNPIYNMYIINTYTLLTPSPEYPLYNFTRVNGLTSNSSLNSLSKFEYVRGEPGDIEFGFTVSDAAYSPFNKYSISFPLIVKENIKRPSGMIFAYVSYGERHPYTKFAVKYIGNYENYHQTILTDKGSLELQDINGEKITSLSPEFDIENGPYTFQTGGAMEVFWGQMVIRNKDNSVVWSLGFSDSEGWEYL